MNTCCSHFLRSFIWTTTVISYRMCLKEISMSQSVLRVKDLNLIQRNWSNVFHRAIKGIVSLCSSQKAIVWLQKIYAITHRLHLWCIYGTFASFFKAWKLWSPFIEIAWGILPYYRKKIILPSIEERKSCTRVHRTQMR